MDISKELKEAIAKVREEIAEARAASSEILDNVKKGATEASVKAVDKTQKAMAKVEAALVETRAKSAKEVEELGDTIVDITTDIDAIVNITTDIEEHLEKAEQMVFNSMAELERTGYHLKDKSIEETEKAIAKVRETLKKVEELIAKIK